MMDALIGHTGFVGGTLAAQRHFSACFNSSDIAEMAGRSFDTVVCAGVSAVKWLANKQPEADLAGIRKLTDVLSSVKARRFVLISTVDVYRDPVLCTERDVPLEEGLHAYGRHRLALERFVAERFAQHSIVRLPALFGPGLKKNALYDLMHGNQVDRIVPNARFQWYPLIRLADDLDIITAAGIGLINIVSEPVTMAELQTRWFPAAVLAQPVVSPPVYDIRSIHADVLGGSGPYQLSAAQVFSAMDRFLAAGPGK
jgi:nucleoside-diphosphate-sugar epimerase